MVLETIKNSIGRKKLIALLIDPDKVDEKALHRTINEANSSGVDFVFVGGSLVNSCVNSTVDQLKSISKIPVVLFPGSVLQVSHRADALLLLSLISGRNPDFLIGNHVVAAQLIRKANIEVIPTGYMLIDGGKRTSVEYMSNTFPIPRDKSDIAVSTAMAGEMLGHQLIYMDAGSGAALPVGSKMIREVKRTIGVPLIIGGGMRSALAIGEACLAGADMVVVGTIVEEDSAILQELAATIKNL